MPRGLEGGGQEERRPESHSGQGLQMRHQRFSTRVQRSSASQLTARADLLAMTYHIQISFLDRVFPPNLKVNFELSTVGWRFSLDHLNDPGNFFRMLLTLGWILAFRKISQSIYPSPRLFYPMQVLSSNQSESRHAWQNKGISLKKCIFFNSSCGSHIIRLCKGASIKYVRTGWGGLRRIF